MRENWFKVAAVLVLLFVFFAGCGKKEEVVKTTSSGEVYEENGLPKDQKVTVKTVFPIVGYGKEYFQLAVETFQERFPNVTIDVKWLEEGNKIYSQMLNTLLRSGSDKEMYTLFPCLNDTLAFNLATDGKIEKQDDLWERELYDTPGVKVKDILIPEKRDFLIQDHIYYMPSQGIIYGIYYNKKMFQKYGWEERPRTWEDFLDLCSKIKGAGIYPLVMAGKHPYYFEYGWAAIPYEVGGDEYREAEYRLKPDVYKSSAFVDMLKKMELFAKKGYFHPGTVSFDHTQSQMEFVQGKAAMITNATWIANEMKEVTPEDFEWGFMAFPGNDTLEQKQIILARYGSGGVIWSNKPELEKKWAKEFVLWLFNMAVQRKFAQSGGVPIRKDFVANPDNLTDASPSVVVALDLASDTENFRTINHRQRERIISNNEMAKLSKVMQDGYIFIITGQKTAEVVANEINRQYMKGLELD